MARLDPALSKYSSPGFKLGNSDDDGALVKLGTLKAALAWIGRKIPNAGPGFALRRSPDGDIWTQTVEAKPWQISSTGKVHPAYVGLKMPTLAGGALDTTSNVLDLTQHGNYVYFKLNFTVTYVETYLASWVLDSVSVEQDSSVPASDADTKYLAFNRILNGAPAGPSYFNQSINVRLVDAGASATALEYNP
jgi:hypothetical protein